MKKTILCALLLLVSVFVYGQLKRQATKIGWVKNSVDTMQFTTQSTTPTNLTVTNDSLPSNILAFRTDIDTTWRYLLPGDAGYTYPRSLGKYLYRKALKDSVYSRVMAD
jgi:hypothetical protein